MTLSTLFVKPSQLLVLAGLLGGSFGAHAQRVELDNAFGAAGAVATGLEAVGYNFSAVSTNTPFWTVMGQMLVQADGRVLVCGADNNRWTVRRYTADGKPDASFGSGGSVTTTFPGAATVSAVAQGMAVQPDGKIVVVGGINGEIGANIFAVARYDSQGNLDSTFGQGGLSYGSRERGPLYELARVAILPNGNLLAVASYLQSTPTLFLRLLPNGQPDITYTPSTTSAFGQSYAGIFQDLAVQPDGKVLIATATRTDAARVARYTTEGLPDTSFGTNGEALIQGFNIRTGFENSLTPTFGHSLAVQPDGKILLAGHLYNGQLLGDSPALFRFTADGLPDIAFNKVTAGSLRFAGGLAAVTLQTDGSIVVGGSVSTPPNTPPVPLLARYSAAGALNDSFGSNPFGLPSGVYAAASSASALVRSLAMHNGQLYSWEKLGNRAVVKRYQAGTITATQAARPTLRLQASPVPTNSLLKVAYTSLAAGPARLLVHDPLGRLVHTTTVASRPAGPQSVVLDLHQLRAGSYMLTVEAGAYRQTTRIALTE